MLTLAAALICVLTVPLWADVTWTLDDPDDVMTTANLQGVTMSDGLLVGLSAWDPYFNLRLPEEGLDVSGLPYLTARIYSSAEADVLDVYYKCGDGRWGLGRTLPIHRGWAVYRADLREAAWTESGMVADARQWGGVSKRIVSFRLDPGNQADRWIVVDEVALTAEPTGPLGLHPEPRGTAAQATLSAPRETLAGRPIRAEFSCRADAPAELAEGVVLLRLMSGAAVVQVHPQRVDLQADRVSVTHEFPISAYSFGGDHALVCEVLELDGEPATYPVTVANPRVGAAVPPVTRVADYRGSPTLFVNDEPQPLIAFLHHGGKRGLLHREMGRAGITLYMDWFGGSQAGNLGQIEPGVYDYGLYDSYFATVLDAVPDAYFIPHIGVTAPRWWQEMHSEECALFSDGRRGPSSIASELWRREMGDDLRRLIAHLRGAPYADRILGVIFYSGYTAEWQMWGTWRPQSDDYSEPALRAFRAWLGEKYGTDAALRAAWADAQVTLATAQMPSHEQRQETSPFLRDPAAERQVIDFNQFISDLTADAISHFARVTKEALQESQVAGTYYGYMAAHGARQQDCGHNALEQVLRSPDIDFLMSPPMYAHRQLGGTSTFMSATESVMLHGKLWLDESDLRTYLSDPAAGYGRTTTPEDSVAVTWREFANVLTRRAAVSWFDMGGGWFSGEPMWDCYRRQVEVAQEAFGEREPFHGEVAVFVDERSYAYYRFNNLTRVMVTDVIARMPEVGVTWDFYLLSDLPHADLPAYRLYVLLNAANMDEATHRALVERARRDDATVLYVHAPGYAREDGLDAGRLEAFTGMSVDVDAAPGPATYLVEAGHPLAEGIAAEAPLGPGVELAPRPVITDAEAEAIAHWTAGGVCMARKVHEGVNTVYCAGVAVPPALLRNIARAAGAHVWSDTDDGIYTDGRYFALHAATDGEKTIRLPGGRRIVDVLTGEEVSPRADVIQRTMQRGETLFLRLED